MVNHSVEVVSFTDKEVHTQSIEGYWLFSKFKKVSTLALFMLVVDQASLFYFSYDIPTLLALFLFSEYCKKLDKEPVYTLMSVVG